MSRRPSVSALLSIDLPPDLIKERKSSAAFSETFPSAAYDLDARERKARTALAVLNDYLKTDLARLTVLDIGASTGSITHYLANHFGRVVGADIDRSAVAFARRTFRRQGLDFGLVDGMELAFRDNVFDVAICNHVYEHLPDPRSLLDEVYRVLKPRGVCYFAADNRLTLWEPHYRLPLLSAVPRPLSHLYLRLARGIKTYDEKLLDYWSLRNLVARFSVIDYTRKIIQNPSFFDAEYMLREDSFRFQLANLTVRIAYWLCPGYIWLLRK